MPKRSSTRPSQASAKKPRINPCIPFNMPIVPVSRKFEPLKRLL